MRIKSVTIYRPDGKGYLEIGKNLLDEAGNETNVSVTDIKLLFGRINIVFSSGEKVIYGKFPYIVTIN